MHHFFRAAALASLAALCGCSSVKPAVKPAAIMHYQHVANVHQIHFTNPVTLSAALYPVHFMVPVDAEGFWAIFVLCSIDVTPRATRGFHYDAARFQVEFEGQAFGALPPYTLRYQALADLNTPADTAPILDAVAAEVHEGPPSQVFHPGFYPDLNYRFAVFVPKALPNYAGSQLRLRYAGQPALLVGNGYPPSDLPAAGGATAGVAAACLP
ncbi:MAG TPA: hypothetical protein VFU95_06810 [Telluria sp.]|nr:hypothetical protein [Telluria sp.]